MSIKAVIIIRRLYNNMADFVDEDDDLEAAFVCTIISTVTLLNLYAKLSIQNRKL